MTWAADSFQGRAGDAQSGPVEVGARAHPLRPRLPATHGTRLMARRWLARYGWNTADLAELAPVRPDGARPARLDRAHHGRVPEPSPGPLTAARMPSSRSPTASGTTLGLTDEDRRRQVADYLTWVRKNRPRLLDACSGGTAREGERRYTLSKLA